MANRKAAMLGGLGILASALFLAWMLLPGVEAPPDDTRDGTAPTHVDHARDHDVAASEPDTDAPPQEMPRLVATPKEPELEPPADPNSPEAEFHVVTQPGLDPEWAVEQREDGILLLEETLERLAADLEAAEASGDEARAHRVRIRIQRTEELVERRTAELEVIEDDLEAGLEPVALDGSETPPPLHPSEDPR